MLQLTYDREEILRVIDKVVRKTMAMDLTWDWPCGVAYYGVTRAYEIKSIWICLSSGQMNISSWVCRIGR